MFFKLKLVSTILVISVITLTIYAYFPGLLGGYMLDDLPNLRNIAVFSRFEGFDAFMRYILSYDAGILKRPISTLSFLLDTTTLTVNPFKFKVTNLIIHSFNGVILYMVSVKLLRFQGYKRIDILFLSITNMALWLLNPFLLSTTLYIIQRMAMLPATFVLLGLLFYLKGRELKYEKSFYALVFIFIGVYVSTFFAVLSKENGIILPILILLLENLIIKPSSTYRLNHLYRIIIKFPAYLILVIFIIKMPNFLAGYTERNFSLFERLMTESRVLTAYLYHLFVPSSFTAGVYTDGFVISRSLVAPISTLFSLMFIIGTITYAVLAKRKYPLFSLGILFFFTCHIIESSFLPLELYFEHRNYMPSLFLFLFIPVLLLNYFKKYNLKYIIALSFIVLLSLFTHTKSILWGDGNQLIDITLEKIPNSIRAIDVKVQHLYKDRNAEQALRFLDESMIVHTNISLRLNQLNIKCLLNKETLDDFTVINSYIETNQLLKSDAESIDGLLNIIIRDNILNKGSELALSLIQTIKRKKGFKIQKINKIILSKEIYLMLDMNEFDIATEKAIIYLYEYHDFNDLIKIIASLIEYKEYTNVVKIINIVQSELKLSKYRYTDNDYMKELGKLKLKLEML